MSKYKCLLWDLDDTLFDFKKCEHDGIVESFRKHGKSVTEDVISLYSKINDSYWKRLERQEITRQEVLVGRFRSLFETLMYYDMDAVAFQNTYHIELGKQATLMDGAWEALSASRDMGFCNYVITNGVAQTQKNRMRLSHLDELVDGVFISEELGVEKPSPVFFTKALKTIESEQEDITRDQILVVGDSLTSDMLGGYQSNLDICWINVRKRENDLALPVNYEIFHLMDIITILV